MKRSIYSLFAAFAVFTLLNACKADEGEMPGNDPVAVTTLYVYNAQLPNDPDCDAIARVATNSATTEVYLLAESEASYKAHDTGDKKAFAEYVISNGKKVEGASAGAVVDVVVPGLKGQNYISVAAKDGNVTTLDFFGETWNDICTGTYTFSVANVKKIMGTDSVPALLQQSGDDPKQFRIKNLFALGKHLLFYKDGRHYADGSSVLRVPAQSTPLVFGNYGSVSVRDVAFWQGDEGYLDNAMDDTNYCYFWVQYYVTAGNMGYGYDEFTPDEN